MDIVYILKHSQHNDEEIRYSLRSVARHVPWVRKVWIFGDRPSWLTSDTSAIEHVPHDAIAWVAGYRTPVTNMLLMLYLVALLPDVESEFVLFTDDYILLQDYPLEEATRIRYLSDLTKTSQRRGTGLFKEALWRTYDVLGRMNLPRLNYEAHVPAWLTKRRVLAAVRDFRDFLSEDRFFGPLAQTAIFNHAQRREGFEPVRLAEEGLYAGFHRKASPLAEIVQKCEGKRFLNFDDAAFSADMQQFVRERFPEPSRFEQGYSSTPSDRTSGIAVPGKAWSLPEAPADASGETRLGIPASTANLPSLDPGRCVVLVMYQGSVAAACDEGLRELERRGYAVRRVDCGTAIDRTRSQAASDALRDGFDETMWIDGDIVFKPDDVNTLRSRGLPLSCGIYPRRGQRSLEIQALPETTEIVFGQRGGLIELQYVSAGFLHVRRGVYEGLAVPHCDVGVGRTVRPFFQPITLNSGPSPRYLSEAYSFCHRVRSTGIPIVADTTLRLGRVGPTTFSWEEAGSDRQRFTTYRYQLAKAASPQMEGPPSEGTPAV